MILSCVGDLGVNRLDPAFVRARCARALCPSRGVPQIFDNLAVTGRGERFQPKVDADLAVAGRQIVGNLDVEANPPFTARVLNERAALSRLRQRTPLVAEPAELLAEISDCVAVKLATLALKRNPTKSAASAARCSEPERMLSLITGFSELLTY